MNSPYRPMPEKALEICRAVNAPPRLVAHLTLVHDVACRLVEQIQRSYPDLQLDTYSVFFGAATHDIGKATYSEELVASGNLHEAHGVELMKNLGISTHHARFAFSHGNWQAGPATPIEDLLVALSDKCWKGKRVSELENAAVKAIADATARDYWEVFVVLDDILENLAVDADQRLAWQAQFPAVAKS